MSTTVFVSGSRSIKSLPFLAIRSLEIIIAKGFTILVGDCFGVDTLVQDYLAARKYRNVIVCHIGARPRNNRGFQTHHVPGTRHSDKDAYMGQRANYGLAIWDGVSPGTAKNIARVKTKVIQPSSQPNLCFTTGNMFDVPADIRINTVNCVGVMGAGVALAFKRLHPLMFSEYQHKCSAGLIRPGLLHIWQTPDGERIVNFPTKRHWRDNSRYEDIEAGLIALRAFLLEQGPARVTLPALGCGHGRLSWKVVAAMIAKHLNGLQARITVFQPSDSHALTN